MIRLIIYDLDGTLIDSSKDIANCVNWTLEKFGYPPLGEEKIRSYVGSGVVQLMAEVLKEAGGKIISTGDPLLDQAVAYYKALYPEHFLDHTRLYPGIENVLEHFKMRKQAVITNKTQKFSKQILKGLKVDRYFFSLVGGDQKFQKKPSPESILAVMNEACVSSGETVMVGDSAIDVETGKNAKVKTIAVTYGFRSHEEIKSAQPDYIFSQPKQLMSCGLLS